MMDASRSDNNNTVNVVLETSILLSVLYHTCSKGIDILSLVFACSIAISFCHGYIPGGENDLSDYRLEAATYLPHKGDSPHLASTLCHIVFCHQIPGWIWHCKINGQQ